MPKSKQAAEKKPEDYVYNLPEGYTLPEKFRARLDQLVRLSGITEFEAQMFVDLHIELTEDFVERLKEAKEAQGGTAEYAPENETNL